MKRRSRAFSKGPLKGGGFFQGDAADLANLRNSFVHYREREASEPDARRLDAALQFLQAAKHFVEYLAHQTHVSFH